MLPFAFFGLLAACQVSLPSPSGAGASGGGEPALHLGFVPDSDAQALPPIVWIEVSATGGSFLADDVELIQGSIGPAHMRELADGEVSAALAARIIPTTRFEGYDEGVIVIAPAVPLVAGVYTVAVGSLGLSTTVTASGVQPEGSLRRIWPPVDATGAPGSLVYCGEEVISMWADASLAPGGPRGVFSALFGRAASKCLRFVPSEEPAPVPALWIPPPVIGDGAATKALDPAPLATDPSKPSEIDVVACEAGEVEFGPGCATIDDDRIVVRPPEVALLWSVEGPGVDAIVTSESGDAFAIGGLAADAPIDLSLVALTAGGTEAHAMFSGHTAPPHAHVVLNEVYANPVGEEPDEEWVELYNDGSVAADLGGMAIEDIGGHSELPSVELPAAGFALVVNDDFVGDEYDPAVDAGALVVRVPKLGKNGLSNAGEPLKLVDPGGAVVSRFPAEPTPEAGVSVARRSPDADDALATSFCKSADGASPGAFNTCQTTE